MNALVLALALCLQDPVPGPQPAPQPVIETDVADPVYFRGATDDEKLFIDGARNAIESSDKLNRIQKFILKRRLSRPRFVKLAMREYKAELFWNDPDKAVGAIDWSNIDWAKMLDILLILIKLFA